MSTPTTLADLRQQAGLTIAELAELTGYNVRTVYRWENNQATPHRDVLEKLYQHTKLSTSRTNGAQPHFTFIDLFAGIGGMRMGFEKIGGKCVFTSEWNKYARQTYLANFACDHPIEGDITKIKESDIPKHDVLLAGFPCQPFSIAGVSKKNSLGKAHGFKDRTQGTLFFDIARIIAHHQPIAFVLENVRNLTFHDKGNTFKVIKETLEKELGYTVSYKVINAKSFVPQHRERVFIVGFKNSVGFSLDDLILPAFESGPKLNSILHSEDGLEKEEAPFTQGLKAKVSKKYTLSEKLWDYLQKYAAKHKEKGNGFGFGLFNGNDVSRTLSARYYKDGSEILIKQSRKRPRRLTPRECARLMGYDRLGRPLFKIPVSDTQAYKQFGNGVVVPVVEAVAEHMKPYIYGQSDKKISQPLILEMAS